MFNADLALSVTMTAISTLLSVIMLPANLLLYARLSYDSDIIAILDWWALATAIAIVISAIGLGLYCSEKFASKRFHLNANRVRSLNGTRKNSLQSCPGAHSCCVFAGGKHLWGGLGPLFGCLVQHRYGLATVGSRLEVLLWGRRTLHIWFDHCKCDYLFNSSEGT